MLLPDYVEAQVQALAEHHGAPARVVADLPDGLFDPVELTDRYGEVCMVIRRPSGRLLVMRKQFYPPGVLRLLTGGVAHGEAVADALVRELAEETGLDVAVARFLAVIAYRTPAGGPDRPVFMTFAFLLDELGGVLTVSDPDEQVEAFDEVAPAGLPALAEQLESLEHRVDRAIGGSWRSWGLFRAVVHRVVAAQLAG